MNPYNVLGIYATASQDEIKSAYRKLAKQFHPDVNKEPGAEERFKEISAANDILSDEQKRAAYDRSGTVSSSSSPQQPIQPNSDVEITITLKPSEALREVKKILKYQRAVFCPTCNGTGGKAGSERKVCMMCHGRGVQVMRHSNGIFTMEQVAPCMACHQRGYIISDPCTSCSGSAAKPEFVEREITIPLGAAGNIIGLAGGGSQENPALAPGRLIIGVMIEPHPEIQYNHDFSISYNAAVDPVIAMLGAKIKVPTLEGNEIEIDVPALSRNHSQVPVPKNGLYYRDRMTNGLERAPLIVNIMYDMPASLSEEQRAALQNYLNVTKSAK